MRKTVHASGRFVRLDYGGEEPAAAETLEALLAIASDPRHPPQVGILIDRSDVPTAPSTERIKGLVSQLETRSHLFRGRRIAVVYAGLATFGMLRMAQILGEPVQAELRMFETVAEAEEWLLS